MTDNPTGPELFTDSVQNLTGAQDEAAGTEMERYLLDKAAVLATQAQTAAIVMLTEVLATAANVDHHDLDAWREAIPPVPLKECRALNIRRPECAERHTEDCDYADPAPEPDSALASLLSRFERTWNCEVRRSGYHNGDPCTPGDPHAGWNCGYVWKFPLLTDKGAREIGLTTDSTKED